MLGRKQDVDLIDAVERLGENFHQISQLVFAGRRRPEELRKRYYYLKERGWSPDEVIKLQKLEKRCFPQWILVARELCRPVSICKEKFESLNPNSSSFRKRHQPFDDPVCDGFGKKLDKRLPSQRHAGGELSDQSDNGGAKMKGLFKSKPRTPADIVRQTRDLLLLYADRSNSLPDLREEKIVELSRNIREMKSILYGNNEAEPVAEACAQLTQEFFKVDTLRLLITCLPKLNLETRKDATQLVVANLQRQQVNSRSVLEANLDLMDVLMEGYENTDLALHYGAMFRECIRHQIVAKYVLESEHVKKFFDYIQLPNFDIAADAAATFKELLTRNKSTVAEFLTKNEDWFFADYNSKLLESSNYRTRREAIKLLRDILLDQSNSAVVSKYVSSRDNRRILMNLLRESSKREERCQTDFHHTRT